MNWIQPCTFSGEHATLVPLALDHCNQLCDAVRDGRLWNLWYTSIPKPEAMRTEIQRRLDLQSQERMVPFTVLDSNQTAVGMTTYMNLDPVHRRLEIGSTWYAARAQRTAVNTECKYLLLRNAFEQLDCIAVEFRTSFFNQRSRRAIERLGAKLDGILRSHQRHSDGSLRDTCVYSITAAEWPTVRASLQHRLRPRIA